MVKIGQIVIVHTAQLHNGGNRFPAIVVQTFNDTEPGPVNMTVFFPEGPKAMYSVTYLGHMKPHRTVDAWDFD